MSLKTAKTLLKVMGILSIIGAVLGIIVAIAFLAGGGLLATNQELSAEVAAQVEGGEQAGSLFILVGIGALISAVIELLDGIFSVRASKDSAKWKPAWIFAILSLIASVITLIMGIIQNGASGIISNIVSIALAVLIFVAANTVKSDAGQEFHNVLKKLPPVPCWREFFVYEPFTETTHSVHIYSV